MSETSATVETRELEGLTIPTPGTFRLDPTHSQVGFVVRHMKVAKVRGRFQDYTGSIQIGEEPTDTKVEVTVKTESVDTREEARDAHLRSADFFESEVHAEMSFVSTKVEHLGGNEFELTGDLTIKGVTKPVVLHVEFDGVIQDPYGNQRIGFSASGEIDRYDYGLNWNAAIEAGGLVVSRKVTLEIEVEAIRSA
ncbi:MAG: YceI family protein [Actinomycetota bacterium]|nr:YceI family protein [Actinomycetota bacterium]